MYSQEFQKQQEFISKFLNNALAKQKLARAYLFVGDAIEDKLACIKELAQILNCEKINLDSFNEEKPCNECINCKWILQDSHPLTPIFLKANESSKKGIITIEAVKNLQEELAKSCSYHRVIVINDASYQSLTKHSANALLKVIEEPNPNIIFVLFANDADQVLATIKSRCQVLRFQSNSQKEYSEEAIKTYQDHKSQLLHSLLSNDFEDSKIKLEKIKLCETLNSQESAILLELFELAQNDLGKHYSSEAQNNLQIAKQIFKLEQAKSDVKAFIRPQSLLEELILSA